MAMEGARLEEGVPVYDGGHATHMYGPLLTGFYAMIFRVAGFDLVAARLGISALAIALVILLTAITCWGKPAFYWTFAGALFLALNFRTNLVSFSMQPDAASALFAVLALYLWAIRSRALIGGLSIVCFVFAFLFKQTSAAFALIPAIQVIAWTRPIRWRQVAVSLLPVLAIGAVLIGLRVLKPLVFSAMVTVPASISVHPNRALLIAFYLAMTVPVFLVAISLRFRLSDPLTEVERWICSGLIVLVPVSLWIMCKSGSDYNSLLFVYLATTSFYVIQFERVWRWLGSRSVPAGIAASLGLVTLYLVSSCFYFERSFALLISRCGDERYNAAVAIARRSEWRDVISPQDPTIAYRATGYLGRSLFLELDKFARNGDWPDKVPPPVQDELAAAKAVIQVNSYVPTPMFERALRENDFYPVQVAALSNSAYTLWARK